MKLVSLLVSLFAVSAIAAPAKYNVDAASSKVEWLGKKVTGQHNGTIGLQSGNVSFDGKKLVGGEFTIDMKTIKNVDLTDAGYNKKLTDHLNSDDFFSTAKHPTAKLVIKSVKETAGKAEVTADLTIKGKTLPVTFPADVKWAGEAVSATGVITIDRTAYDVKYGSGKFFQNLGDKMIDDNFTLTFTVNAKK